MTKRFTVYDDKYNSLGEADTFKECKDIHWQWLVSTNDGRLERYAGLDCTGEHLSGGIALPAFYMEAA